MNVQKTDLLQLKAIGCDGLAVNNGYIRRVICLIELPLSRPLQWFVRMLHANELPLQHLFKTLDGATSAPDAFLGPIVKTLVNGEKLPIIPFQQIFCDFPYLNSKEPNTVNVICMKYVMR